MELPRKTIISDRLSENYNAIIKKTNNKINRNETSSNII